MAILTIAAIAISRYSRETERENDLKRKNYGNRSASLADHAAHAAAVEQVRSEEVSLASVKRIASYLLIRAFEGAEREVRIDPYNVGPNQRFLMQDPQYEWDSPASVWCAALDIDYPSFRDRICGLLDELAKRVILDPDRHGFVLKKAADKNCEEIKSNDARLLELFLDLPMHMAPGRDVMRASGMNKRSLQNQLELLAA